MISERLGLLFLSPLTFKNLEYMISEKTYISVEVFQNNLGDTDKGIIIMVQPVQLSSYKKFLKLPS